ncbi:putative nucleic acid-binding protein [Sphingobium sp. B1D7B]|uniref:type II toxin-antitoxin system VapC family toxin n=1 Tax=Sphingobium sp. B1D7B TaxID=2940578 RepID=UPI002225B497|nr:type II toxin-antitoxin system VapC family toxin [Sphingobium sp. B1D7B]MCW2406936.1 putative nucleic acid-binding protein [Sphingobium sp. B1D7B]
MIVLDTNVISEAMRPIPSPIVRGWLDQQIDGALYITTITQAEVLFGISKLPSGAKRDRLATIFKGVERLFAGRILSFDSNAARSFADLASLAKGAGRGFPTPDGYIAAIAASAGFSVATRDVAPFEAAALTVINPWEFSA